ncbi:MAG: hypothetical protein KBF12_11215 [Sebaldella sp.]|nr:hypothetical protein [Sebaldella sp.]
MKKRIILVMVVSLSLLGYSSKMSSQELKQKKAALERKYQNCMKYSKYKQNCQKYRNIKNNL